MTRARLYDVYFRIGTRWIHQLRTFFPLSVSEQRARGNTAKNIPVRQRAYIGKEARYFVHEANEQGFSSGYWRFVENMLFWGFSV